MNLRLRSYVLMLAAAIGINAVASQQAAAASMLFGVAGGANSSTLYTIDVTSGAATTVGDIGFAMVGGISFNPLNGLLYGVTNGTNSLITINTTTGAGTLSKSITPSVTGQTLLASDIAFDPGGTLFAWNETNSPEDRLATIDLGTGVFTNKGSSGLASTRDGLAFNGSSLYLKAGNAFLGVNPATGVVDLGSPITANGGILFDALTFGAGGLGYSVDRSTGGGAVLYRINAGLTTATQIGNTGVAGLDSLAFSPDVAAVPEPGSLLLLGTGVVAVVRRRRAAARR
jgi:hypothetical protein